MLPEVGITFRGKGVLEPMQAADDESIDPEPAVRRRGVGVGPAEMEFRWSRLSPKLPIRSLG